MDMVRRTNDDAMKKSGDFAFSWSVYAYIYIFNPTHKKHAHSHKTHAPPKKKLYILECAMYSTYCIAN